MCNACGFLCCGSDEFSECGCDHCEEPDCHSAVCFNCGSRFCDGDCDDPEEDHYDFARDSRRDDRDIHGI